LELELELELELGLGLGLVLCLFVCLFVWSWGWGWGWGWGGVRVRMRIANSGEQPWSRTALLAGVLRSPFFGRHSQPPRRPSRQLRLAGTGRR